MKFLFSLLLLLALPVTCHAGAPSSVDVPILMYHKVCKDPAQIGKFAITPSELARDLAFLAESAYTPVVMADLIAFVLDGTPLPERPVVLTFDDGFFSDHRYLLPLVLEHQVPVVSSIIGQVTDAYTSEGRTDILYPHVTWPQVAEMAASGLIEIQNHSYDLHCTRHGAKGAEQRTRECDTAYANRLQADLSLLQTRIQEQIGTAPTTFTYPFGAKSACSDQVLQSLGFSASLATEARVNTLTIGAPDCLFSLGRMIRPHGRDAETILGRLEASHRTVGCFRPHTTAQSSHGFRLQCPVATYRPAL